MLKGAAAVVLVATLGTFFMYRHTLDYGFHYDDYHFIRPYSSAEVRATFHGPWDASGIEVAFYRPLTVAFYAARFELFGIDSRAHHAVNLSLFAIAAMLLGGFAAAIAKSWHLAALATLVFVVHPAMPYSLVAWVTNQMHLIETIVVLLGLIWWALTAHRSWRWWMPLLGFGAAAFLIKEDGIMLLPAIVVLHWLRRRIADRTLTPVPKPFLVAVFFTLIALVAIRAQALGGVGGYAAPTLEGAWRNYSVGLDRAFRLIPADRPWQMVASWFAVVVPISALALWRATPPAIRYTEIAGGALAVMFNLPFALVSKAEQMHLVAMGLGLMIAASLAAVLSVFASRMSKATVMLVLAGGLGAFAAVGRDISRDFEPFGPVVLSRDQIVREWAAVPEELRDFLRRKQEPGASMQLSPNPIDALDVVAFGLHPAERSPHGLTYRWMSQPRVELHVARRITQAEFPLRHDIGAFREPVAVAIEADGRPADALVLTDDAWHVSQLLLRPRAASWTRRTHRVRLTIPRVWRPSEIIRGSTDTRPLGLQIGDILVR